jgi:hypothetical protein
MTELAITMPISKISRNIVILAFIISLSVPMVPTESNNPYMQTNEIVTTGKLSKLEHFDNDEKVRTK